MKNKSIMAVMVLNLLVSVAVLALLLYPMLEKGKPKTDSGEKFRRLAALYESNELYGAAAFTYERFLDIAELAPKEEANIHHILGDMYYEKLKNFDSALAHYLAAEDLNKEASWKKDVEKKIIACFESLGRKRDAQNRLDASTALVPGKGADASPLLATVGKHEIRMSDLEEAVGAMPPETREQLKGPQGVPPLLNQVIREWLLYDLAQKKGLPDDPQVLEQMKKYRKMYLANLAYQMEMDSRIKITDEEAKKFYDEHPDEFKDKEGQPVPFQQAKNQIIMFLKSEKARELDKDVMTELGKLEEVKVYEENLPKAQKAQ